MAFGKSTMKKTGLRKSEKITMAVLVARERTYRCKHWRKKEKMILNNCRLTIREIADDVGVSHGSCQAIFTDVLGKNYVAAKIVAKFQNFK